MGIRTADQMEKARLQIIEQGKKLGWKPRQLTPVYTDNKLYIVIMYNESKQEYITSYFNTQDNGFFQGFYTQSYYDAKIEYNRREDY